MQKILSTGVLVRDPASFNAHIDVVNIDSALTQTVTVEIFDWGVDQLWNNPTPVPVGPSGPVTIGPHTHQSFIALITQSTAQPALALALYEIRITIPDAPQVVVNCFALDASGAIIEGDTVLHEELVEVDSTMAGCCVNSIADLKALPAGVVPCLTVLGYYTPADGGGGGFCWDASAIEPDNAGTIIAPAPSPAMGRWKRLVDGPLSVKWFGAKGDVQTASDGTINAGSQVLDTFSAEFVRADEGKWISIQRVGPAGVLFTTIASVDNGLTVTLSDMASATAPIGATALLKSSNGDKTVANCVISASSNKLTTTSTSPQFVPTDKGSWIAVQGAGPADPLITVIKLYVSATQVKLADAASTAVSGPATLLWGTDDWSAIQGAIAAMPAAGAALFFPPGVYGSSGPIYIVNRNNFAVRGSVATILVAPKIFVDCPLLGQSSYSRQLLPTYPVAYGDTADCREFSVLEIFNCSDWLVAGLILDGNYSYRGSSDLEHSHGINLNGCHRFTVQSVEMKYCQGDGIVLSAMNQSGTRTIPFDGHGTCASNCSDFSLLDLRSHNIARNSISIVGARNGVIDGLIDSEVGTDSQNSASFGPWSGLHFEVDPSENDYEVAERIIATNLNMRNHRPGGLLDGGSGGGAIRFSNRARYCTVTNFWYEQETPNTRRQLIVYVGPNSNNISLSNGTILVKNATPVDPSPKGFACVGIYLNGQSLGTQYQNMELDAGTLHTYTVAAFDAAGNLSAQCDPVSATTLLQSQVNLPITQASARRHPQRGGHDTTPPSVPINLAVLVISLTPSNPCPDTTPPTVPKDLTLNVISASEIDLSWSPSTDDVGVAGYIVYRDGAPIYPTTNQPTTNQGAMTDCSGAQLGTTFNDFTHHVTIEGVTVDGPSYGIALEVGCRQILIANNVIRNSFKYSLLLLGECHVIGNLLVDVTGGSDLNAAFVQVQGTYAISCESNVLRYSLMPTTACQPLCYFLVSAGTTDFSANYNKCYGLTGTFLNIFGALPVSFLDNKFGDNDNGFAGDFIWSVGQAQAIVPNTNVVNLVTRVLISPMDVPATKLVRDQGIYVSDTDTVPYTSFTVRTLGAGPDNAARFSYRLAYSDGRVTLACPASPGHSNVAYTSALTASGGVSPYVFSIPNGALPPGLFLDSHTGAVTGTPTTAGTFSFTAKVVDSSATPAGTTLCNCSIVIAP